MYLAHSDLAQVVSECNSYNGWMVLLKLTPYTSSQIIGEGVLSATKSDFWCCLWWEQVLKQ